MPLEAHRQRLRIVTSPPANLARNVNIRQAIHLNPPQAVALARLAAPALHVEAEPPGTIPALARFRQHGKKLANRRKHARVSSRIRSRRAPNRRLIDLDDL